ncbi:MAG TPA: hypothetical protein DFR83_00205 [Deltaproteobacteria bacterium]|nr:hypothetical protein [Deltaproteobacteria bacterium]
MTRLPLIALSMGVLFTATGVAHAGAVVSNNQKETRKGANYYAGNAALDGKDETAWLLPGDSENIGEYIIIDVPRINIDKLQMKAGWHRDEDTFKDYARVKKVSIEASYYNSGMELVPGPKVVEAEFVDEMGWQMIDLDDIVVEDATNGGKLKITILEVYPGKDFPQVAMGDLVVHLGEFDAVPKIQSPSTEDEGSILNMQDENTRTSWIAPADNASFSVKGGGVMLSSLDITSGPATHARPKTLKLTVKNRTETVDLPNSAGPHHVILPSTVGYTGTWNAVKVEVVDVHPGKTHADKVAIAEITGKATALDGL